MEASGCEIGLGGHIAPAQQKRQQESQEASVTVVPIAPTVASDSPSSNPVACAVPKKPTPKRAIVLTGVPTPALPPRPAFSSELEQYQVHGAEGSKLNSQVQAYLSSLRQDYERQLREYDMLKKVVQEDTYFAGVVVDELDALDEDPFTLDSFENLMRLHASKGKDFIVARVTTQDPNDEAKLYHSYYGAHQINKVLFRTQPEEGLLHRMKARNPLNNMLVVGDVHYYTISAKDVNAIKPLPAVSSSSSSISSHSSRMSRCSKLAAQAIASQLTSARSSPILGGDMSLFSRSSDIESPVSVVSPSMATSIHEGEQEDGSQIADGSKSESSDSSHSSRPRRGSFGSVMSSTLPVTPTGPQRDTIYSPTSPPTRHRSQTQQLGQSPLFQNLMNGRVRSRSNTITSVGSDKSASSILSDKSDLSHVTNCSTVTSINSDMSDCSNTAIFSPSEASVASPVATSPAEQIESVTYRFQYLASDDDFLLRSAIRLIFKTNALEAWDAILFTISNNALRGYSGPEGEHITITPQHPEPPLESAVQGITQDERLYRVPEQHRQRGRK
ncbi:hypothetical protein BGX31_003283 [Mortierella sp. GBA43]|nr:hypothetical protein BGX31_003283 [Mortierella sp. GBA43]